MTPARPLLVQVRAEDQVICRWLDRLGRNYDDATGTIRHLMAEGVNVKTVINAMVFDGSTTDPIKKAARDAMIAFMSATAQAQAESTNSAQKAGIAYAKYQPEVKYRGRKPSYARAQFDIVRTMLDQHQSVSAIGRPPCLRGKRSTESNGTRRQPRRCSRRGGSDGFRF
jgi:putative DNA-invertase from lambdoid prophage Rac